MFIMLSLFWYLAYFWGPCYLGRRCFEFFGLMSFEVWMAWLPSLISLLFYSFACMSLTNELWIESSTSLLNSGFWGSLSAAGFVCWFFYCSAIICTYISVEIFAPGRAIVAAGPPTDSGRYSGDEFGTYGVTWACNTAPLPILRPWLSIWFFIRASFYSSYLFSCSKSSIYF